MVARLALILALLAAPMPGGAEGLSPTAAASLSPSAAAALSQTALAPLEPYAPQPNKPVEDFFVVSITSLPFTGLWTLVGAALVGSISQKQFPPNFSNETILSSAAIAVGSSLCIGLVSSISWGSAPAKPLQSLASPNPALKER